MGLFMIVLFDAPQVNSHAPCATTDENDRRVRYASLATGLHRGRFRSGAISPRLSLAGASLQHHELSPPPRGHARESTW
jgi:hypothetical protein